MILTRILTAAIDFLKRPSKRTHTNKTTTTPTINVIDTMAKKYDSTTIRKLRAKTPGKKYNSKIVPYMVSASHLKDQITRIFTKKQPTSFTTAIIGRAQ